jgi:hypothetical protein
MSLNNNKIIVRGLFSTRNVCTAFFCVRYFYLLGHVFCLEGVACTMRPVCDLCSFQLRKVAKQGDDQRPAEHSIHTTHGASCRTPTQALGQENGIVPLH